LHQLHLVEHSGPNRIESDKRKINVAQNSPRVLIVQGLSEVVRHLLDEFRGSGLVAEGEGILPAAFDHTKHTELKS
jgi:hypothetical protein